MRGLSGDQFIGGSRLKPDEPFLRELYADRREPELASVGWPVAQRPAFLDMQFGAQQAGYAATYPDADHWIVVAGGRPVGRLLVARNSAGHRVVDLVIHSRWRGRGIGTALMREVIADADQAGVPAALAVDAYDPRIVGWYERLGFTRMPPGGAHMGMMRRVR